MRDCIQRLLHPDARSWSLTVAGLRLRLDAREIAISIAPPPAHRKFMSPGDDVDLSLAARPGRLREVDGWQPLCATYPPWQLWQDGTGSFVFVAGRDSPPGRQVTVDAAFRSGDVLFDVAGLEKRRVSLYPLADLDMVLFANWLANSGDLILHASGVAFEGRGYCFAGRSGAGKSTLASAFFDAGLTVLGEDNLVLRYLDGRFWIFGTPWHQDLARCSPLGAPLEKLYFLDRMAPHGIARCPAIAGTERLLQTAFIPYYRPDAVGKILQRLALLAERVPFFTLSHRLGSDVMELLRTT